MKRKEISYSTIFIVLLAVIQIVLLVLKATNIINTNLFILLIPTYILFVLFITTIILVKVLSNSFIKLDKLTDDDLGGKSCN